MQLMSLNIKRRSFSQVIELKCRDSPCNFQGGHSTAHPPCNCIILERRNPEIVYAIQYEESRPFCTKQFLSCGSQWAPIHDVVRNLRRSCLFVLSSLPVIGHLRKRKNSKKINNYSTIFLHAHQTYIHSRHHTPLAGPNASNEFRPLTS